MSRDCSCDTWQVCPVATVHRICMVVHGCTSGENEGARAREREREGEGERGVCAVFVMFVAVGNIIRILDEIT